MNNFDFHNLLAPTEFETFCTHVLEIRENPIKFTTYRRGRDGGIDIKSTNTQEKIIGQCKLYIPQNERGLINNLKKELLKCKRLKLDRYIICVNINLSVSLSKEILELFKGYKRCEEDIIDGQKLNKYLEQPAYEYLFKIYSKLLVPNLKAVEIALEKVINRKFYNISRTFLLDLIDKHKLYHNTEQLQHLIQKLEEDKVIILSGNPGVGKTTTAKMIANYFINRKKSEVFYLGENDYAETTSVLENNRLIIVDDFWGQNFSPKIKDNSTYEREFVSLINNFKSFDNSYLILISREYILKDILKNAELETEHIVRDNKYIIQLKDYSKEDKVKIFLNHLIFYDFELAYLESLSYSDEFEHILNHKNYSPRILEIFIKRYKIEVYQSSYDFYDKLHKYLDNPIEYWTQAFKKLSPNAQLILLVLLITSDPMNSEDLRNSFNSVQEDARNYLNLKINPQEFETEKSDIVLYGEKIVLNESLKKELKNKILTEFETLQFSNYEEREFSDQLTKFYTKNETKYLKLHTISRLLNIDILNNKDVKEFVLSQISKDFERFKINKGKIVEHHSMIYFPSIIKRFFPYLNFTKNEILTIFYESITFAIEYDYFYDFKEIFPIEFNYFYTSNILNIRKHIKELIEDDIDYYLWEDNDLELDTFTSFTIEELSKKYKFRLSTKYLKNLENTFDIKFPFKHKEKRKSKIKSKKLTNLKN
ncbi:MAG: AAA family ATPase [Saprospiraceae bacterium]|nr:AAA family ATPase [Saprospiraceae bacterium]